MTNTIVSNNMEYEYLETKNKTSNDLKQDDINNCNDHQSQVDENNEERDFDTLILQHFTPFSGKQAVNQWLDETEGKFNHLKISRHLRFEAISLLVEGNAKRLYIKNRNEIRSFDDFYEFLLSHFDTNNSITSQVQPCTTSTSNFSYQQPSGRLESNTDSGRKSMNTSDATHFTHQPPALRSTAIVDFGATNIIGETLDNKSTKVITNSSVSILDQTTNDLRKAIVEDLIKNPKVFKGGKDDVNKWIEDIEHLLNLAHVPEPSRLDLISYSLRSDALQWFKNNKNLFTSWSIFITEIKRAFTSSFHEELAFKKLESYNQGENQSIRNFFNEVLKLCREADPTMSEATKLKNLLNKTKPTVQFEVRKKKPTTTAEFLEYAKDVEELFQLSSITIGNNNSNPSISKETQSPTPTTIITSRNKYYNSTSSNRLTPQFSNYFQNPTFTNRSNRNNSQSSTTSPSLRSPQSFQSQSRTTTQQPSLIKYNSSFNNNGGRTQSQAYQSNSSSNNRTRQRAANIILSSDTPSNTEFEQEPFPSISCTQCNQYGHEASSCQNF